MTQLAVLVLVNDMRQVKRQLSFMHVNPNARDADNDRTPLHWAAARSRDRCVDELLRAGADPTLVDASGSTPAELARRLGNDGVAMRLEVGEALPDPKQCFEGLDGAALMVALNQPSRLSYLLRLPLSDPNTRDPDGDRMPLHWGAARGHRRCVQLLLDARASPHVLDAAGRTPADLAQECRHGDVHALLETAMCRVD